MSLRLFVCGLVLALLALVAWSFRDSTPARRWWPAGWQFSHAVSTALDAPADVSGLRKCLRDGKVSYTDAACPAGSREQAVGGSLTVVPAQRPVPASDPAHPQSVLRALVQSDRGTLQEQRMEKAIDP